MWHVETNTAISLLALDRNDEPKRLLSILQMIWSARTAIVVGVMSLHEILSLSMGCSPKVLAMCVCEDITDSFGHFLGDPFGNFPIMVLCRR